MKRTVCFLYIFFLLGTLAGAQTKLKIRDDSLQIYLSERGEAYVSVLLKRPGQLDVLAGCHSVDKVEGNRVWLYAGRGDPERIREMGLPLEVLRPPSLKNRLAVPEGETRQVFVNAYPGYREYCSFMQAMADSFPGICRLEKIGTSVRGKDLLCMKITDHPGKDEGEPSFFYTSTMHGDETLGFVLLSRLISHLLTRYDRDARIARLVNKLEIWINPLANPDGTYFLSDTSVYGSIRFNSNGIDLNRNFPDPGAGQNPDGESWQPETIAMMDFMKRIRPVLSANIHTGAEVINYPWDTWARLHPDDKWYRTLARSYVDTLHRYNPDCMTGFHNGITNGFDWYSIQGGRQDYVNYFLYGREVTMELSDRKIPDPGHLDSFWQWNYRSLIQYMEQTFSGIHGRVEDADTGEPVGALIEIPGHDADHSYVYADSLTGRFIRLLEEGSYQLKVSAEGYREKLFSGVRVHSGEAAEAVFPLEILPDSLPKETIIMAYPNPFPVNTIIRFRMEHGSRADIRIYGMTGKLVAESIGRYYLPGINEFKFNPPGNTSRMYICMIITPRRTMEILLLRIPRRF